MELDKLQTTPYHTHNGVDSPRLDFELTDLLTPISSPASPAGGVTVDSQARTAIVDIITKLQTVGIFL